LPREGAGSEKPSGPLRVAFASPKGDVGVVTEITVVFDRPVQPLGVVSDGPAPFRVAPEVPGSFRWVGSRAAVFAPRDRLPFATRFAVEVPAGVQALDGTRLPAPHAFEFETRRPAVMSTSPAPGQRGLPLQPELRLELNQVVSPAALRSAAKLQQLGPRGEAQTIPFEVRALREEPRALVMRPTRKLAPNSQIQLTVDTSLRGVEGPLGPRAPSQLSFFTYEPLALAEVSCARARGQAACEPDSDVSLVFNNAVRPRDLQGKLRVTPELPVKLFREPSEADSATSYVSLTGNFQPGQSYRIEIEPGVIDQFGQSLAKPASATFSMRHHYATVEIGAVGRNFPGRPLSLPVASRNVPSFELLTAALSPADVLAWFESPSHAQRERELEWLAAFPRVAVQKLTSNAPRNQVDRLSLDTAKLLGGTPRGVLAIGARYHSDAEAWNTPQAVKIVNLSDLGISAKLSRFGSLVWVTDRNTNAPVAGAEVGLLVPGRPERKYATNSQGLAHIPAVDYAPSFNEPSPESRALIVARHAGDLAFAPVAELIDGYRLEVPTDFSGELRLYGVAFTDRGIYRPGDEVQVKGIVRQQAARGDALPGEKPVTVSLRSPNGDEVATQPALLTGHGTFASKLRVPSGGELGSYEVAVLGPAKQQILQQSLEVAEYRPVELRVSAGTDQSSYVSGASATFEVKADYLFGAVAAGLETQLSVARQPSWFEVPGAAGYSTSAETFYWGLPHTSPAGELRRESRKLDAQGQLSFSEKLDLPGQRGPELVRIDAEVTDVSRRTVATTASALVHPAAYYLGLKLPSEGFVSAPGRVSPQVLAFELSGQRVTGRRVALELIERRYSYAREPSGGDYRGVSKAIDKVVSRCELTTGREPGSCALDVPAAGYFILVARSRDAAGKLAEAAVSLYATGPGEPTWQDSDRRSVELVLDKKSYAVGERARVLVKSPYREAEALITVERSGVYHSFHRVLHGTAPSFEIPVGAELMPNAFVGVQLLPKRSGKDRVLEPGSYRVGYANLLINADARRLNVKVTPNKQDFRPGEQVDVKLSVKDARGAASANTEVTLYAADEGVLSLIDYRTPDPLLTFTAPRPLQVATLESRDAEGRIRFEAFGAGRDKGRDGGGGGDGSARSDFRQTAYFNPRILTDERGEAKVSFKLPESLTTYRLMAVAVERGDRYGFSQERITSSKPLMARPTLPRFVRAGDEFEAGLIVSKKGLAAGKVQVVAALGALSPGQPLTRVIDVPANGSVEVRFPAMAKRPGVAALRFDINAGSERDSVQQTLRLQAPMTPEVAAVYGQTAGAQSERLGDLAQIRDDVGGLSVSLSSTALVGVDQVLLDVLDYPYGCTEQLASKILPLVSLTDLAKALGFALPPDSKKRAEAAVNEVLARQQGDGGFGMWPGDERSSVWVSSYAALALGRAAKSGLGVPKLALNRAADYLRGLVHDDGRHPTQLPIGAFALDVLAELGQPDAGGVNRLFARRKTMPLFAKALLLRAAIGSKLGNDVPAELTRELEAGLHVNGDRAIALDPEADLLDLDFHSPTRTQALVLRALAARGKHPLLGQVARGLLGSRKQGRFRTTQEGAWALLALEDYRRVAEPEAPSFQATLSLGDERLGGATFGPKPPLAAAFEVPLTRLLARGGDALVFEKQGAGKLFYEARLRYVRRELPSQPLDAGFFVEKSVTVVSPTAAGPTPAAPGVPREVKPGELLLVDVTVVSPAPREYVVIDDALPAGLEAIDPRLSTTADWLRGAGLDSELRQGCCGSEEAAPSFANRYDRSEVRDDRVLFFVSELPAGLFHYRYWARATTLGRFVVPPTRVEEMYQPEVFGRTGATELIVR
jgi:uncharacterized protein YfaS (alpha-2-macroglobulin family)